MKLASILSLQILMIFFLGNTAYADVICDVASNSQETSITKLKIVFVNFDIGVYSVQPNSEPLIEELNYEDYTSLQYNTRDDAQAVEFMLYYLTGNLEMPSELIFGLSFDVASGKGSLVLSRDRSNSTEYQLANCHGGFQ